MLSRENAARLQSALNAEDRANAEVQSLKNTIRGQEQELANAQARHGAANAELQALFEELTLQDPPQAITPAEPEIDPPAQLDLAPAGKRK